MQLAILGPLEVVDDGHRVSLGGKRQRAVLARLLVDAGRVVSVDRLIEDVWDGHPPATATKTLQKYVSELRKVLGPTRVRTQAGGYLVDLDGATLDVEQFVRFLDAKQFDDALGLWRGEVLADMDLAFVAPERARLDELRIAALEGRFAALVDAGRHVEVLGDLAEMAAVHPLHERFTALHMLALYRSGRQVEALRAFEAHRRRLRDEVGVEPATELRELEAALLRQDPALELRPSHRQLGNLPAALTSFVGRSDDLSAVECELEQNRLVTLTGPGGVGKTRLALELGARLERAAWIADLAPVRDVAMVPDTVATVLGVDVRHAPDVRVALTSALIHRTPFVLILDNCEHLVSGCRELVVLLLQSCPNVTVLATSRRPIGVEGEYVRPVFPLPRDEALSLFVQRARLAGAHDLEVGDVEEICDRLDRLPLAIELAASQLRVLGLAEIASRLRAQLPLTDRESSPPRQRSLTHTVAWSYGLLSQATQRAFARLGVFASSFTLDAAEAVCGADALVHLSTLVDHSMIVRLASSTSSRSRYRMLETLRAFALERLAELGELDESRRAHAEHFRVLVERGGAHLWGPQEQIWRRRLEGEEPNIHAALGWAEDNDADFAMRFAVALWPYWDMRWGERNGVAYVRSVLDDPTLDVSDEWRAWGLTVAADLSANPGDARKSVPWATEAVAIFRTLGNDAGLRNALLALGSGLGNEGRLDEADEALAEATDLAQRANDEIVVARALNFVSFVAARRGDFARAAELNRAELARWAEIGSARGEATGLRHLAVALLTLGDLDEAERLCERALALWTELEDPTSIAHVRATLGDITRVRGDLARAEDLYTTAMEGFDAVGDRRCMASTFKSLGMLAASRSDHAASGELFRTAFALRHELGDEAGLAECLEGLAGVALGAGRGGDAAMLLGAADVLRERTGSSLVPAQRADVARLLASSRLMVPDSDWAEAWESGRSRAQEDVTSLPIG